MFKPSSNLAFPSPQLACRDSKANDCLKTPKPKHKPAPQITLRGPPAYLQNRAQILKFWINSSAIDHSKMHLRPRNPPMSGLSQSQKPRRCLKPYIRTMLQIHNPNTISHMKLAIHESIQFPISALANSFKRYDVLNQDNVLTAASSLPGLP